MFCNFEIKYFITVDDLALCQIYVPCLLYTQQIWKCVFISEWWHFPAEVQPRTVYS